MTVVIIIQQDTNYYKSTFHIPHLREGNIAYYLNTDLVQFSDPPLKSYVTLSKYLNFISFSVLSHKMRKKNHTYLVMFHKLVYKLRASKAWSKGDFPKQWKKMCFYSEWEGQRIMLGGQDFWERSEK